ncbi:Hypothetical predicted protein [Cloeon dipterum]|uniref:Uncharacterized protein n=1 Tax=Cloeon dipterum TaxID=197152 RepID=A0A8S1DZN4_9INSE|nr:Hypothetical predicted protein [Cloeon dipterum]
MKADLVNLTVKRLEGLRANRDSTESQDVRKLVEIILCSESDVRAKILDMDVEMRERVLQEMLRKECWDRDGNKRMFNKMLSAFMLLLSPLTRSLDLSRFFSFCPKHKMNSAMEEVLGWIAIMAPEVNHLILEDSSWNDDRGVEPLSPDVLRSLSELDKLSRLQAGQSLIAFSDLLHLCQTLPKLRFLKVFHASKFDPEIPLEVIKRSLGHLRALVCTVPFFVGKNWLLDFFAKLPNIEVFNNCSFFDIDARDFKFRNEPYVRFLFFTLDGSLFSHHDIVMLRLLNPKVTHLMVEWTLDRSDTCRKQDELLKFENIEALSLQNVQSAETVIGFVFFYGKNLHTFILAGSIGDDLCFLSLNLILKLTPNLKTLSLDRVILKDDSEPLIYSARLTDLRWKM